MTIKEMELTNTMIGGSIKPINELTNMYSNNADLRKRLLINLMTGNPFKLETNLEKRTQNNNTKVLNAYFSPINVSIDYEDSKPEELETIMDLNPDELELFMDKLQIMDLDLENTNPEVVNDLIKEIKSGK